MISKETIEKINQLITGTQDITIFCGNNFDSDAIASALALYLSLSKLGKNVSVVTPKQVTVEFAKYVGIDKITHELLPRKFIVSLNEVVGNVDKVSHYLEDNRLNIVIHTLPGAKRFTSDDVSFRYDKPNNQLLIMVGVDELNDLGSIYTQEQELFSNSDILVINKTNSNLKIAGIAIFGKLTISEAVVSLIGQLKLPIDVDIANNLFLGIADGTDNFKSETITADSLEAAAFCLRIKEEFGQQEPSQDRLTGLIGDAKAQEDNFQPDQLNKLEKASETVDDQSTTEDQVKEDWLVPKIYKSSNQIQ